MTVVQFKHPSQLEIDDRFRQIDVRREYIRRVLERRSRIEEYLMRRAGRRRPTEYQQLSFNFDIGEST